MAPRAKQKEPPIGELLRCARLRLKLDADTVGAKCNVSRSRVYQWESDDHVMPKNLRALSAALNIPLKKLKAANGPR